MWILFLIMLPFAVGIGFYARSFITNALETFGVDISDKRVRIGVCIAAACVGALCINILRFGAIIVLHVTVLAMLVQLVNFVLKKAAGGKYQTGFNRWKKLYGSGIIPLVLAAALLAYGYVNMHNVVQTSYTLYTDKDIGADGYRIVLVSDVHYGVSIGYDKLVEKCNAISALQADVVILGGDIVDSGTKKADMQAVFSALGNVESKHGVYYVYGNHDRARAHGGSFTNEELVAAINAAGIKILQDETAQITDSLVLVGREDKGYSYDGGNRKELQALMSYVDKTNYIITLDHQPTEYKENANAGVDLILSGHTHGGQLWPANLIMELFGINDAVYGAVELSSTTTAIVSSGFAGWSYPIKTAAPAEYVVIDIKKGM